jgi:hypothetical protein
VSHAVKHRATSLARLDAVVAIWAAAFSTDPELVGEVTDLLGLYVNPPENPIVLSVDAKSKIQAQDRTAPIQPLQPGLPERRSHDYLRHGTLTPFAPWNSPREKSPHPALAHCQAAARLDVSTLIILI